MFWICLTIYGSCYGKAWIRIRILIEVNCRIRIRVETDSDPKHCLKYRETLAPNRQKTARRTWKYYFFLPTNYNPSSMLSVYWSLPNTRYDSTKQTMCFLKITAISLFQQRCATHQLVVDQWQHSFSRLGQWEDKLLKPVSGTLIRLGPSCKQS
jgi:hypothetical protein